MSDRFDDGGPVHSQYEYLIDGVLHRQDEPADDLDIPPEWHPGLEDYQPCLPNLVSRWSPSTPSLPGQANDKNNDEEEDNEEILEGVEEEEEEDEDTLGTSRVPDWLADVEAPAEGEEVDQSNNADTESIEAISLSDFPAPPGMSASLGAAPPTGQSSESAPGPSTTPAPVSGPTPSVTAGNAFSTPPAGSTVLISAPTNRPGTIIQFTKFGTEWYMNSELWGNLTGGARAKTKNIQRRGTLALEAIERFEAFHAERTTCAWTGLDWDAKLWDQYMEKWQKDHDRLRTWYMKELRLAIDDWDHSAQKMAELSVTDNYPVQHRYDFEMYCERAERLMGRYYERIEGLDDEPTLEKVEAERKELREKGLLMTAREGGVPMPPT